MGRLHDRMAEDLTLRPWVAAEPGRAVVIGVGGRGTLPWQTMVWTYFPPGCEAWFGFELGKERITTLEDSGR